MTEKNKDYLYKQHSNDTDFFDNAIYNNNDYLEQLMRKEDKTNQTFESIGRTYLILQNYITMKNGYKGEKYPLGKPRELHKTIFKIGKFELRKKIFFKEMEEDE